MAGQDEDDAEGNKKVPKGHNTEAMSDKIGVKFDIAEHPEVIPQIYLVPQLMKMMQWVTRICQWPDGDEKFKIILQTLKMTWNKVKVIVMIKSIEMMPKMGK